MARGQAQIQCLFVNSSSEEGMQADQYAVYTLSFAKKMIS